MFWNVAKPNLLHDFTLSFLGIQVSVIRPKRLKTLRNSLVIRFGVCSVIEVEINISDCCGQNVINHHLKVFGKVVNKVVARDLCSVFQKLMKVVFRNLYLVIAL